MIGGELGGRYSYLLWDPFWVLEWGGETGWTALAGPSVEKLPHDPFSGIERILESLTYPHNRGLPPFQGGLAGYFGYELAGHLEEIRGLADKNPHGAAARWVAADLLFAVDHQRRRAWAISHGWPERGKKAERRAHDRLNEAVHEWSLTDLYGLGSGTVRVVGGPESDALRVPLAPANAIIAGDEGVEASLNQASYRLRFSQLRRYIEAGDLYQANLTIAYQARYELDPWSVYQGLTKRSPAPYSSFIEGEVVSVASASPELFLSRRGNILVSRPIKGTRPRSQDSAEDARLAKELLQSEKDKAEHVMIVDVHRNDMGRVSLFGTVNVTEPWKLESFATLHHMTSTIESKLVENVKLLDPIRVAFPAGSITGAPKIRAMEVIAELEPHARGAYTGALGWISSAGDFDLAVGIRTVTVTDSMVEFPAGGGIVADSDADAEYQEAWDKARSLWAAIRHLPEPARARAASVSAAAKDDLIPAGQE